MRKEFLFFGHISQLPYANVVLTRNSAIGRLSGQHFWIILCRLIVLEPLLDCRTGNGSVQQYSMTHLEMVSQDNQAVNFGRKKKKHERKMLNPNTYTDSENMRSVFFGNPVKLDKIFLCKRTHIAPLFDGSFQCKQRSVAGH